MLAAAGVIAGMIKKHTPTDASMDLNEYYGIQSDTEVPLIIDTQISEAKGKRIDGVVYVDYTTVKNLLNSRFYWDMNNGQMLYATADAMMTIVPEEKGYKVGEEAKNTEYPILKWDGETLYVALDFVEQYSKITCAMFEAPTRVVITGKFGRKNIVIAKKATPVRYQGGIKSAILTEVSKGAELFLLEELDNWSRVMTADGFDGYVEKSDISKAEEKEFAYSGAYTEDFPSQRRQHKINLAWHQVTSEAANGLLADTIKDMSGVNVISPTWFSVTGTEGTISSLASAEYVQTAHDAGLEVWGLIDNFDSNVSTLDTLSDTASRAHIIEMLVSEAKRVNMDGINLDFEALTEEEAPHFVQFVRELSIACRKNKLVFSIDDPVPHYTQFYNRKEQGIFADYIIIMGYDENTEGSETAGSVASLPFVERGIRDTLSEVPAEKVINGVPFYTRLWRTAKDGTVSSEVLGMDQADKYVADNKMETFWDKEASQNYGELVTDTETLQIWLEDESSLGEKMKLVQTYNLAGAAQWKLGFERKEVWQVISQYLQ